MPSKKSTSTTEPIKEKKEMVKKRKSQNELSKIEGSKNYGELTLRMYEMLRNEFVGIK